MYSKRRILINLQAILYNEKNNFSSLLLTLIASAAYAQFYKDMEIKAGTNLSSQYIHSVNEEPQTAFKSGWQFGLAKQWKLTNLLFAELGTGVSQHGSKVLTQSQNMWGGEVNSWEKVRLRYGFVEAGFGLRKTLGRFEPFAGTTFRYGHKLDEQYSSFYRTFVFNSARTSDFGLNFKTGTFFKLNAMEPFVELSYYQGFYNLLNGVGIAYLNEEGEMVMSSGNMIRNTALALQLGFRF